MANKSLYTKLKETVDADLPKFGEITIKCHASIANINNLGSVRPYKASVASSDGYFTVGSDPTHFQEVNVTNSAVNFVKNQTGEPATIKIDVLNTGLIRGEIDFDNIAGSYEVIHIDALQGFIDGDSSLPIITSTGAIDNIGMCFPNLQYYASTYGRAISGSIMAFVKCLSIATINLQSTNIIGDIGAFATAQVSAGRTSGSVIFTCNGIITYDGSAVSNGSYKTVKYGSSMVNPTTQETNQGWQVA